jgi:hypothetical protein
LTIDKIENGEAETRVGSLTAFYSGAASQDVGGSSKNGETSRTFKKSQTSFLSASSAKPPPPPSAFINAQPPSTNPANRTKPENNFFR